MPKQNQTEEKLVIYHCDRYECTLGAEITSDPDQLPEEIVDEHIIADKSVYNKTDEDMKRLKYLLTFEEVGIDKKLEEAIDNKDFQTIKSLLS